MSWNKSIVTYHCNIQNVFIALKILCLFIFFSANLVYYFSLRNKNGALRGTQGTGNSEFFKQNKPGHSLFSSFRAWVCDITGGKVIVAGRYVWSKGTQGWGSFPTAPAPTPPHPHSVNISGASSTFQAFSQTPWRGSLSDGRDAPENKSLKCSILRARIETRALVSGPVAPILVATDFLCLCFTSVFPSRLSAPGGQRPDLCCLQCIPSAEDGRPRAGTRLN